MDCLPCCRSIFYTQSESCSLTRAIRCFDSHVGHLQSVDTSLQHILCSRQLALDSLVSQTRFTPGSVVRFGLRDLGCDSNHAKTASKHPLSCDVRRVTASCVGGAFKSVQICCRCWSPGMLVLFSLHRRHFTPPPPPPC